MKIKELFLSASTFALKHYRYVLALVFLLCSAIWKTDTLLVIAAVYWAWADLARLLKET